MRLIGRIDASFDKPHDHTVIIGRRHRRATRAIIAVVALYGLLLQGVVSAMVGGAPLSPAAAAICAPGLEATPTGGQPAHSVQHECCTAASLSAALAAPEGGYAPVLWPSRAAEPSGWADAPDHRPTGPPDRAVSPRGPPTV